MAVYLKISTHEKPISLGRLTQSKRKTIQRRNYGVYLRLNNIPAPSIYGPSADEGSMG